MKAGISAVFSWLLLLVACGSDAQSVDMTAIAPQRAALLGIVSFPPGDNTGGGKALIYDTEEPFDSTVTHYSDMLRDAGFSIDAGAEGVFFDRLVPRRSCPRLFRWGAGIGQGHLLNGLDPAVRDRLQPDTGDYWILVPEKCSAD